MPTLVIDRASCLHIRPGRLTMLECRFNKTTHHIIIAPHGNVTRDGHLLSTRQKKEQVAHFFRALAAC